MEVQRKSKEMDKKDPVSVIRYLSVFKMANHNNGIHEIAGMWLVLHFMKRTAVAYLTEGNSRKSSSL